MHPKVLVDVCSDLLRQVLAFQHPADAVVARFFRENRGLGPRERATLSEAVYAVLRNKLLFDHLSPSGSGAKERRMAILGLGLSQGSAREFLNGGLNDLEKSWLRQCDQVDRANLMDRHRHNLPQWLVDALQTQGLPPSGPEFWALVKSLAEQAPLDLRVNAVKAKVADVQLALTQANLKVTKTPFSPLGLRLQGKPDLSKLAEFKSGAFEIQDEGSQLLALLLDAKRGEMVVDFCAGAGGKTLAIAAAMRNSGRLYAFDTSAHRLEALKPRLARSGLSNVHPVAIAHERDDRIKRLAGKVDRVLVDAPCSGLGTLRRHPDLKWRQTLQSVQEMAVLQGTILKSAARMVKSGGRLVYATCSLLQQENEEIALAFSRANPEFQPLAVSALLAELKIGDGASLCTSAVLVDESAPATAVDFLKLWPHRHQTDGFFAAVWQKK